MTKRLALLLSIPLTTIFLAGSARAAQSGPAPPSVPQQQTPASAATSAVPTVPATPPPASAGNMHTITVKFNYDFTKTPPCPAKIVDKKCVAEFDVYDVSGGKFKLFTIPAPAGATGMVTGITGKSPRRTFEPGLHFIAVTAKDAAGNESSPEACRTSVQIAAAAPVQASAPAKP